MTQAVSARSVPDQSPAAEWLGCVAVGVWAYGLMVSPIDPRVSSVGAYWLIRAMLFIASVVATAIGCEHDIARLTRVTVVATPVAAACTAVMYLFPEWANTLSYSVAVLCLGPLVVRRVFGVVQVFGGGGDFMMVLVIPVIFACHVAWAQLPVSTEAHFAILAIVGVMGLWLVWKTPLPRAGRTPGLFTGSGPAVVFVSIYLVIVVVADFGYQLVLIMTAISWDHTYPLSWGVGIVITGLIACVGAFVMDRNVGRPWLIVALASVAAGLILSMSPGLVGSVGFEPVLLLTYGVGAGVTSYLLLTFLPRLVAQKNHAMLLPALGVVYITVRPMGLIVVARWVSSAQGWSGVLPSWFYVVLLVLTVTLFGMLLVVLRREDARGLVEAMVKILALPQQTLVREGAFEVITSDLDAMDRKMVALLADGHKVGDISHTLAISPEEVRDRLDVVRSNYADPSAKRRADALATLAKRYNLTVREAEIAGDICDGKSNAVIAADRFITERTVKFHVGNVLAKLHVANRLGVRDMVGTIEAESGPRP